MVKKGCDSGKSPINVQWADNDSIRPSSFGSSFGGFHSDSFTHGGGISYLSAMAPRTERVAEARAMAYTTKTLGKKLFFMIFFEVQCEPSWLATI